MGQCAETFSEQNRARLRVWASPNSPHIREQGGTKGISQNGKNNEGQRKICDFKRFYNGHSIHLISDVSAVQFRPPLQEKTPGYLGVFSFLVGFVA
jgi:hypothetical protein